MTALNHAMQERLFLSSTQLMFLKNNDISIMSACFFLFFFVHTVVILDPIDFPYTDNNTFFDFELSEIVVTL